jgi:hypothetical protein
MVEKIFMVVTAGPTLVHVLQIPGSVNEYHGGSAFPEVSGFIEMAGNFGAVAGSNLDDGRINPGVLTELGRR